MSILIYGAYGYTGRLVTQEAQARDLDAVIAGRNHEKVDALAQETGLPARTFALDAPRDVHAHLEGITAVLHCAGPFVRTAAPMVSACLNAGVHYLDITGEIEVFEALAARSDEAAEAGAMLLPGVGFDVVPTDCLAAHLAAQQPSAMALEVAFMGLGRISRGTMKTAITQLGQGGAVRRDGQLQSVPPAWTTRTADFGTTPGTRTVVSIPWGDLSTAYRSTGIPNITTYTYLPATARRLMRWSRYLQPLLAWTPVKQLLLAFADRQPPGPSDEERARGSTHVWASVRSRNGAHATGRLHGPEGYTFTARAAVEAAARVLHGEATPGYQTPATAFGPDFVLSIEGVEREDADERAES
jgi:saccharopine dehydrogenase (NAD+, L-lysine-forming)